MTTVTDYSDELILFTVDSVNTYAFKKYIKLYADRPNLRIEFLEYVSDDQSRDAVLTIDFHDVTSPVVTSAFELETEILAMIGDGAGGGPGTGEIFIDDSYNGTLVGAVDGANKLFTVSEGSYTAGKIAVFLNGQLLIKDFGYAETSPAAGTFTLTDAPSGDSPEDAVSAIYQ